jgi:hypothetical protein
MTGWVLYEWTCKGCGDPCALTETAAPEATGARVVLSCPDCGRPEGTTALVPPRVRWICERMRPSK